MNGSQNRSHPGLKNEADAKNIEWRVENNTAGGCNNYKTIMANAWKSHRGREEWGGDDATEAGGGNLHRGRGATAWGREEGGEEGGGDATKAGGGNHHRGRGNSDLPIYPDLESLSVPKTSIKNNHEKFAKLCLLQAKERTISFILTSFIFDS